MSPYYRFIILSLLTVSSWCAKAQYDDDPINEDPLLNPYVAEYVFSQYISLGGSPYDQFDESIFSQLVSNITFDEFSQWQKIIHPNDYLDIMRQMVLIPEFSHWNDLQVDDFYNNMMFYWDLIEPMDDNQDEISYNPSNSDELIWLPVKVQVKEGENVDEGNFNESDKKFRYWMDHAYVWIVGETSDEGVKVVAKAYTLGFFTLWTMNMVESSASTYFTCDEHGNIYGESDEGARSRDGRNSDAKIVVETEGKTAKVAYAAVASWKGSIQTEGGALGLKVKISGSELSIKRAKTGTWECRRFAKD
ncbi:MAG: hypothetical protein H8E27_02850 [Verrucomicrobia subdivision 3 bacterium]|nr:hypothetical protein [Limisphaerales bacterium]